jgi:K+-transporting ATPase ATPase C chain
MKFSRRALLCISAMTVRLGGVYPVVVAGVAHGIWDKPNGSFVSAEGGRTVSAPLIGTRFQGAQYLRPGASATGAGGYEARGSTGRNEGPTASGPGVDPHLPPVAAEWQAARIAKARGVTEDAVLEVIRRHVEPRTLGVFGEPRVNVLLTNLDLDRTFRQP